MGIRVAQNPVGRPSGERNPWLVPPRLRTAADEGDRRASWLELFFDLVFVVAITELAHQLVLDHSFAGFLRFAGLFVPVFVAWQGFSFYADRFDTDDLALRVAFFAAMLAVAAMSVLLDDVARGEHTAAFAVAYATLRSLMLALYARAWRAVPEARPLIRLYGGGYAVGVAIWLASLAVDPPLRYLVWGVAATLELSLPPLQTRMQQRVPTSASHVPERWALFTMIVIGESVAAIALETGNAQWRASTAAAAVLGFVAVVGAWWLYFDEQADVVLSGSRESVLAYSYAHIPLLLGLAAMGAGVRLLIERGGADQLGAGPATALLGGVALFLASLVATRSVTVAGPRRRGATFKLGAAAIALGLLAVQARLPPVAVGALLAAVLVALLFSVRVFLEPT